MPALATDSYGQGTYDYGAEPGLSQGDELGDQSGIPEGMSIDLGSAGEYDLDHDREQQSFGSVRSPLTSHGLSTGARPHVDPDTHGDLSNFLDLSNDSRSVPGSSREYLSSYPPPPSQQLRSEGRHGSANSRAGSSTYERQIGDAGRRHDYSVPMKVSIGDSRSCDW